MGRKSLAKERKNDLLDAFERCILKYGLEGTTLEQIAQEANMTRSIIRHYIGNRDDLVDALIQRVISQYIEQLETQYEAIADDDYIEYMLDDMFDKKEVMNQHDSIIIGVLMTAKDRYPRAKKMLVEMFEAIIESVAKDLRKHYKKASKETCYQVAYALICLSEMHESFMWLGLRQRHYKDARVVAETLLKTLEL